MYYFGYDNRFDGMLINSDIYKFKEYLPRLYYVNKIEKSNSKTIYSKIIKDNFNPENISYINTLDNIEYEFDNSSEVELINWHSDKINFKTNVSSKQFLSISEIYYPYGWILKDQNDIEYKIYEVNECIRGFFVPSGENHFIMEFKPKDVKYGYIMSILSFVFIFIIFIMSKIPTKKNV